MRFLDHTKQKTCPPLWLAHNTNHGFSYAMPLERIALIAALEVAALLLVFSIILLFKNRTLRRLIKKLQGNVSELSEELKKAKAASKLEKKATAVKSEPPPAPNCATFLDYINQQIDDTKAHHATLQPDQDIVLDLAPDTFLPRRAAAFRHAMLLAEKEALMSAQRSGESLDWSLLRTKYQQFFSFYEDYAALPDTDSSPDSAELDAINEELTNAKKRINNLEKFKALYFDLEEQWDASKKNAQTHFDSLSQMAADISDSDRFTSTLQSYHAAYSNIDSIIQQGIGDPASIIDNEKITNQATVGELRHLRMVAADQHRLITELEAKLLDAKTAEDRTRIVEGLKTELDKQKRFIQESDTCIQLLEDELSNAHKELDQLKTRLKALPAIKTQLQELRKERDDFELQVYKLQAESRKQGRKSKDDKDTIVVDNAEASKLKKELKELEARYANLEEKYLDLKMQ